VKKLAEVKWIKITTDIFDDEKIRLIEAMPSADSIIVIWFKLLTLAGKQNNNGVFMMNDRIAYTDEMLATIFRRDINTVRMALSVFENFGMIAVSNSVYTIPNWEKHQTLDQLEQAREQTRKRVAKHREKQKLLTQCNVTVTQSVTQCNGDRLEEDKDKEEDREVYNTIVSYLNEKAGTKYKATTAKTKTAINARLSDGFTVEDFKVVIDKKCAEWIGTEFEKFLRPETLFGTKFEGYLNARVVAEKPKARTVRKEIVPGWMDKQPQESEKDRLLRIMADITGEPETAGNNPDIAARAEALKKQLAK
jgi:predicted phage replisome organizer/uncharacterized phage protein (TIGR02220 family)